MQFLITECSFVGDSLCSLLVALRVNVFSAIDQHFNKSVEIFDPTVMVSETAHGANILKW
jgi:hypothetical protein